VGNNDSVSPRENLSAAIRIAALFLFLAGGVWIATRIVVRRAEANFAARSATHLDREVRRIRAGVESSEAVLDRAVANVAQKLAENPSASRADMFAFLRGQLGSNPQRGIRIVAPNNEAIAWFGEDLRTSGASSYEFDATNLYLIRSRALPRPAIESVRVVIRRASETNCASSPISSSGTATISGSMWVVIESTRGMASRMRPSNSSAMAWASPSERCAGTSTCISMLYSRFDSS